LLLLLWAGTGLSIFARHADEIVDHFAGKVQHGEDLSVSSSLIIYSDGSRTHKDGNRLFQRMRDHTLTASSSSNHNREREAEER
jgi:hypothetical protein